VSAKPLSRKPVPWRCRISGHKWGVWMPGGTGWHVPNWGSTRGSLIAMAECKRCSVSYADVEFERRQTLADLEPDIHMPSAEGSPGLPADYADYPIQPDRFPE
jgi:hypothetical protein